METEVTGEGFEAVKRLIEHAARLPTGQSRKVANFLLAWWNAPEQGGFDLVEAWSLDNGIRQDVITAFEFITRVGHYPDSLGLEAEFADIIRLHRPKPPQ